MIWKTSAIFFGKHYTLFNVLLSTLLCFICGISLSWTSPVLPKLKELNDENPFGRKITDIETSLIGSLSYAGGIFGPLIFGYCNDKLGRRQTISLLAIPFVLGFLLKTVGKVVYLYYIARFLIGITTGGIFCIFPIYLIEISDLKNRASYSSFGNFVVLCGLLFSYSVGPFISLLEFNLIPTILSIIYIPLFYLTCAESPYYFLKIGRKDLALDCLQHLRAKTDVYDEFRDIEKHCKNEVKGSLFDLFRSAIGRKVFCIGTTLIVLQQLSGINVIVAYSQNIFTLAGSLFKAEISSIIVGSVQTVTGLNTPLLLRRFGRKPLLIFSTLVVGLSQILLGIFCYFQNNNYSIVNNINWMPTIILVVFICSYNCGLGSIPWLISGELYPLDGKSIGMSVSTSIYWLLGFLLTFFFEDLYKLGLDVMFCLFGSFCLLGAMFIYIFVIETKDKTLHEIQVALQS